MQITKLTSNETKVELSKQDFREMIIQHFKLDVPNDAKMYVNSLIGMSKEDPETGKLVPDQDTYTINFYWEITNGK